MKFILSILASLILTLAPTYAHCGNCGSDNTSHNSSSKKCGKCGNPEGSDKCKEACKAK
jgi:Zn finger protein HypA/HybF involved in hydrogenase expression